MNVFQICEQIFENSNNFLVCEQLCIAATFDPLNKIWKCKRFLKMGKFSETPKTIWKIDFLLKNGKLFWKQEHFWNSEPNLEMRTILEKHVFLKRELILKKFKHFFKHKHFGKNGFFSNF